MNFTMKYNGIKDTEFVNKSGKLTPYSFACGYVEVYQSNNTIPYHVWIASPPFDTVSPEAEIKLYKEHRCFFVSIQFYGERGENCVYSFDKLSDARKKVTEIKAQYKHF